MGDSFDKARRAAASSRSALSDSLHGQPGLLSCICLVRSFVRIDRNVDDLALVRMPPCECRYEVERFSHRTRPCRAVRTSRSAWSRAPSTDNVHTPKEEEDNLGLAELVHEVDLVAESVSQPEPPDERVRVRVHLLGRTVRHRRTLLERRASPFRGWSRCGRCGGQGGRGRGGGLVKRDGLLRGRIGCGYRVCGNVQRARHRRTSSVSARQEAEGLSDTDSNLPPSIGESSHFAELDRSLRVLQGRSGSTARSRARQSSGSPRRLILITHGAGGSHMPRRER